jgi:hypothetical protein
MTRGAARRRSYLGLAKFGYGLATAEERAAGLPLVDKAAQKVVARAERKQLEASACPPRPARCVRVHVHVRAVHVCDCRVRPLS